MIIYIYIYIYSEMKKKIRKTLIWKVLKFRPIEKD